jgi:hypothetical protein
VKVISLRTELNWDMLEKAAAELPDSLSGDAQHGGTVDASTPKPPRLLERPGVTGAAAAGSYSLGKILKRLGQTHTDNITKPGKWSDVWHSSRENPRPEWQGKELVGEEGVTTKKPYKPNSVSATHPRPRLLDRLRSALSVEPRPGKVLGHTPAIAAPEAPPRYESVPGRRLGPNLVGANQTRDLFTPQQRVLDRAARARSGGLFNTPPRGPQYPYLSGGGTTATPPRTPRIPLRSRLPGRLSGLPSGLKGLGAGLGALSLYNLFRGSESD